MGIRIGDIVKEANLGDASIRVGSDLMLTGEDFVS